MGEKFSEAYSATAGLTLTKITPQLALYSRALRYLVKFRTGHFCSNIFYLKYVVKTDIFIKKFKELLKPTNLKEINDLLKCNSVVKMNLSHPCKKRGVNKMIYHYNSC